MRILIADDHPLYREAIRLQIERMFEGVVVDEAGDLESAFAFAEDTADPIDLFLIDFHMPGVSHQSLARLARVSPSVPIAVISGSANADDVRASIQAGARGFIPKTASAKQLTHAIELILAGGSSVPAELLVGNDTEHDGGLSHERGDLRSGAPWLISLTARELDVLKGVTRGLANKEIARELGLAEVTIKLHLRSIFKKIGARSRSEAAVIATKAGVS
jgi:two-component system, NarL family, nitrate/nitrite response regulator NarL